MPPLQARNHKRVCQGVEFVGKQSRRFNDPWQVSWSVYTAVLDVVTCKGKCRHLAAFVSVYIHAKKWLPSSKSSVRPLHFTGVPIEHASHDCFDRVFCLEFMMEEFSFFLLVTFKIFHVYFWWIPGTCSQSWAWGRCNNAHLPGEI